MTYTRIIENLVLTDTLRLEGSEWDNTLIRNVLIENVAGNGILLRDVDNVRIENVTIRNVAGDGIKLSSLGSTSNVVIADSLITQIGEDGINASQRQDVDHPGLQIIGNTIDQTGLAGNETGLQHGVYVQSTDFVISGNLLTNSTDGNAISVRSSGLVENNVIDGTFKSGIAYFADHPAGASDQLVISDNIIFGSGGGMDRSAIDILEIPNAVNVVSNIMISGNVTVPTNLPAVAVAPGYDAVGTTIMQQGNVEVDLAQAQGLADSGAYGNNGSSADFDAQMDPTPGSGLFPDLENQDNMRLTLSNDGLGNTDVLLSTGATNLAAYTVDYGTTVPRAIVDEMGIRMTALSGNGPADLAISEGLLAIQSASEADGALISDDETLVIEMGDGPVGDIHQVLIGLNDVEQGETANIKLLKDSKVIATFDRPADEIIDIEFGSAFNQIQISAEDDDAFSFSWIEFGPEESAAIPQALLTDAPEPDPEVSPVEVLDSGPQFESGGIGSFLSLLAASPGFFSRMSSTRDPLEFNSLSSPGDNPIASTPPPSEMSALQSYDTVDASLSVAGDPLIADHDDFMF